MSIDSATDTRWKATLPPSTYHVLTHGSFEHPGTGRYVQTRYTGTYCCMGCSTPLFSSIAQVIDGSGFATFSEPISETGVRMVTQYSDAGDPLTRVVCATCGGIVGFIDTMSVQSADDLEQGTRQQLYHISSHAVLLKKAISVRNYPVVFGLGVLTLAILAYVSWMWGATLLGVSNLEHTDTTIPVWLGETEVRAVVVHLDQPQASTSGMVVRQDEALLFVLGETQGVPSMRFNNRSVDILWLDANFVVVGWERERASQSAQVLKRPSTARYGLIAQMGTIAPQAFATGFEVVVTDKTSLF